MAWPCFFAWARFVASARSHSQLSEAAGRGKHNYSARLTTGNCEDLPMQTETAHEHAACKDLMFIVYMLSTPHKIPFGCLDSPRMLEPMLFAYPWCQDRSEPVRSVFETLRILAEHAGFSIHPEVVLEFLIMIHTTYGTYRLHVPVHGC